MDVARCSCGRLVTVEDLPHHGDLLAEILDYMDAPRFAKDLRQGGN